MGTVSQISIPGIPDSDGRVRCSKCRTFKAPDQFYGIYNRWCNECRKADEKRRRRDPEWIAKYRHKFANDRRFRAADMYRRLKKRSKRYGVQFDLDLAWFQTRLDLGTCEITGLTFDFSHGERQPYGPSVDRIQAGGGYTKANCRMVLRAVNAALLDWGLESFIAIAKAIAERYK